MRPRTCRSILVGFQRTTRLCRPASGLPRQRDPVEDRLELFFLQMLMNIQQMFWPGPDRSFLQLPFLEDPSIGLDESFPVELKRLTEPATTPHQGGEGPQVCQRDSLDFTPGGKSASRWSISRSATVTCKPRLSSRSLLSTRFIQPSHPHTAHSHDRPASVSWPR